MKVIVFASRVRFAAEDDLHEYVWPQYSEDGDLLPSRFMQAVGIEAFEPNAVEVIWEVCPMTLNSLLEGSSYCNEWLPADIGTNELFDSAVLVFSPNSVTQPKAGLFDYVKEIEFRK